MPTARSRDQMRGVGHGLLSPSDDNISITKSNHAGRIDDRCCSRKADLVDGYTVHITSDACLECGLTAWVLAAAGLDNLPHDHCIHRFGTHAGVLQCTGYCVRPQIDG